MTATATATGVFMCVGPCWTGDCDCSLYDGKTVTSIKQFPPRHDGCMCVVGTQADYEKKESSK
jgi:hypothetical protein